MKNDTGMEIKTFQLYAKVFTIFDNKVLEGYVMRIFISGNNTKSTYDVTYDIISSSVDTHYKSNHEVFELCTRVDHCNVFATKADLLASL